MPANTEKIALDSIIYLTSFNPCAINNKVYCHSKKIFYNWFTVNIIPTSKNVYKTYRGGVCR